MKSWKYFCQNFIVSQRFYKNFASKGFEEETYETAEKNLCGYEDFWKAFTNYLDNLIVDFYEEKSGIRIAIEKPKDKKYNHNRLRIPPEVGLKYPLNVINLVDSEDFIKNEPKDWKTENCPYVWNTYRSERENLRNLAKNNALLMYPSGASINGLFLSKNVHI